jgi:hypothetical protein
LAAITAPTDEPDDDAAERATALRRLKAYRYLAGVPYADLTLDDDLNAACAAGARLCARLGRMDHTPANPGLPEDEYQLGYRGTSRSNLGQGYKTLERAVDGWMEDSDASNIDRLGHRRWCLHPAMRRTGFGHSGAFTAMYALDNSRTDVPDFDFVSWPPPGPTPVELFDRGAAWSVSLNPLRYNPPGDDVQARVYAADGQGYPAGEPLPLNYSHVNRQDRGIPNCLIFRPAEVVSQPGRGYVVVIDGLTRGPEKTPAPLCFRTQLISLK